MKCRCGATLAPRGKRAHRYADATGRIYKTIHATVYYPCPRLDDPQAHPARVKAKAPERQGTL